MLIGGQPQPNGVPTEDAGRGPDDRCRRLMWHWILIWTGGANGNSWQYLELSGFVPAVLVSLMTAAGALVYHHYRCHEDGCPWPGTHVTTEDNGHHFRRCRTHHQARHPQRSNP